MAYLSSSDSKKQTIKSSSFLDGKAPSSPARSLSRESSDSAMQVQELSSSGASTTTTSTASTEGGQQTSSLPFFYGTHGISLSFAATLSTLLLIIIVLSISLSILFSSFFQSASVGIDLLAKETILQTTHVVDSSFSRVTNAMLTMANITKRFPHPFSPSLSLEVQVYNMQNIWLPQMLTLSSVNEKDKGIEARFASDGTSIIGANNIRGFVRAQICKTKYPTYLDVPVALRAGNDKFYNCSIDVYWVHNLTQYPPNAFFQKFIYQPRAAVGVLGPYWNATETKMRHFMATNQNYRAVFLPELAFFYNPAFLTPFFRQRVQTMVFDTSTGSPISSVGAVLPVSRMGPLLANSLPKATSSSSSSSSSNSVVVFLYETTKKYVFSASNVELPFKFMYLNETGGNLYKGCYASGNRQGCLHNVSDYPPYHLLKLSLSNYVGGGSSAETNWSRVVSISEGNPVYQRKFIDDEHDTEYIAFKRYLFPDFGEFPFQIVVVFPQDFFSGDVVRARSVAIAVVVVISIVGGICCFFVLRISTSSLRKLCDKMKDPFQAKLKRRQQKNLVKSEKEKKEKEKIDNKNENENERSPLVEGESNNNNNNNNNNNGRQNKQEETKEKEKEKQKDLEEEVEEVEVHDNRSWWERIQDWQPDEIEILEEEFEETQAIVLKLRAFMNFDFAHHGAAWKKQQKEISASSSEKKKDSTVGEKEKVGVSATDPNVTATSLSTQQKEQQQQQQEQEHHHKKGVKFDPSIVIPEGPAKIVMTKRKKLEPLRNKGFADYESVVCFAAVCKVPMFSEADRFFNLGNEHGRKWLLDISSAVVSKLNIIGLSNGATLIDFTGDHFLIVIQTRKAKIKTKVPTRLTLDLMKLSEEIDEKVQEFIIKQQRNENVAADTTSVSQTQQVLGSESTTQVSFETTEALKNTKPGKKPSNELDAKLISTEMHRRITLYAGLAFGTARLFRWPDVKFIGTTSASTPTRQIALSSPSQPVFGSPPSGAVSSNLLISSSISRSISFFGHVIPEAYASEAKTRIARLRQERHSPKHCIGFSFADSSMFEAVHSRKLKMSINNIGGGDQKSVLVDLNIARVLLVLHMKQEQEQ